MPHILTILLIQLYKQALALILIISGVYSNLIIF